MQLKIELTTRAMTSSSIMEVFHEKKRKNINCTWNYSSNNFNIAINIESVMGLIP